MFKFTSKIFIFLILASSFMFVTSCNKMEKDEKAEKPEQTKEFVETDSTEITKTKDNIIENIIGTWSGKLDKRETTLKITEQTGNEFKGKITIKHRNVVHQEVSGTLNIETKEISMKDLLHSRYQGTYSAKLTDNLKTMEGTFTMNRTGKKLKFNLNKK